MQLLAALYASAATLWFLNHGLAQSEADMRALIAGSGAAGTEPVSFLLPTRQADLFRWCFSQGLRVIKPMTLTVRGEIGRRRAATFRR